MKKRKTKKQKVLSMKSIKEINPQKLSPELQKELRNIREDLQKKAQVKERTWKDMRILWFSVAPYIKCYDRETEILTDKGWKLFRDLDRTEDVMTYNSERGYLEWQKPSSYLVRDYKGKMYKVQGQQIDLLVTPNHRMLVGKRERNNSWRFREEKARNLEGLRVKYKKTGNWKGKDELSFRRGELGDWVGFLGYYLAEGHIEHNPINGNYTVSLTQNQGRKREKMKKIFQRITPNRVFDNQHNISVRDKELWSYLIKLGYSHEKYIPKEIKELPARYLRRLVEAFREGDGHRNSLFTSSKRLRDDLQEISIKAGYNSNFSLWIPKGKKGTFGKSRYDNWRVTTSKVTEIEVNKKGKNDGLKEYEGKVYCVTVPNSWLLVRRNGKSIISGNSGYGVVTKHFVSRLIDRGFTTMVAAYYGLAKGGFLKVGNIVTFPVASQPGDNLGFASVAQHHKKFNTDIVIFFCYDEETEILTNNGWRSPQTIEGTDKVLTLNPESKEIEYQKPNQIFINYYKGKMAKFLTKTVDLLVVPEHRMFYKTRHRDWRLAPAKNLIASRIKLCKTGKWEGLFFENKDLLRLLGWYISEGSIQGKWVRIYQDDKQKRKEIIRLLKRLDIEPRIWKRSIALKPGKKLLDLFKECGLNSHEKRIPRRILSFDKESLLALNEGLMKGDGYSKENSAQYVSVSKELADNYQELLLKIGLAGDIKEITKGNHQWFEVNIKRKRLYPEIRAKEIKSQRSEWVPYEGLVWGVSVPNKVIWVRRNGKIISSGNTDFWVARPLTKEIPHCVAYTVLDHEDYAEEYQDVLRSFYKVAIASKFGVKEARKYGIEAKFIPHGVDLETYHPLPKEACKRALSVDPKAFVLGIVAANNDKEPRKGWDKMFGAIKLFIENNPEMRKPGNFRVFIHSDATNNRGYNLKLLAKRTGIGRYVIFQDPYMSLIGLPDRLMVRIYNAFDVLMNLSRREGFCLPILEAQACGVPAIATDFSAMTERLNYGKAGWLVKPATTMLSPLGGITAIPDEFKAAEALEEAYRNEKKRKLYGKRSLAFAKKQSWDIAVDKYWLPWLEEIWNSLKAPLKAKKPKVLFQSGKEKNKRKEE